MNKVCCGCGVDKPFDEYSSHSRRSDGKQSRCRSCNSKDGAAWWLLNREAQNARVRERTAINGVAERKKAARAASPHKQCGRCGTWKARDQFYVKESTCKACKIESATRKHREQFGCPSVVIRPIDS